MAIVLKPKSNNEAVGVPEGIHKATLSKVTQFTNAYGLRVGFEEYYSMAKKYITNKPQIKNQYLKN